MIAVQRVAPEEVVRYGIVDPLHEEGRLVEIRNLVEKPSVDDAPSDLAVLGRYVLTPKIFDVLEQTTRGAGGEIQLTDAIRALIQEQPVFGYQFEGDSPRRRHPNRLAQGERGRGARVGGRRRGPRLHPRTRPARLTDRGDDRQADQRPIPPHRPARRGRHGHDLARRRRAARPRGGGQDPPPAVQLRSRLRRPLQAGGALRRRPLPPEHRQRLRLRHRWRRWRAVHRHGARRGAGPVDDPARARLALDATTPCASPSAWPAPSRWPTARASSTAT